MAHVAGDGEAHGGVEIGEAAEEHEWPHAIAMVRPRSEREGRLRAERDAEDRGWWEALLRRLGGKAIPRGAEVIRGPRRDAQAHVIGEEGREHEEPGSGKHAAEPIEARIIRSEEMQPRGDEIAPPGQSAQWRIAVSPHRTRSRHDQLRAGNRPRRGVARPGPEPAEQGRERGEAHTGRGYRKRGRGRGGEREISNFLTSPPSPPPCAILSEKPWLSEHADSPLRILSTFTAFDVDRVRLIELKAAE